MKFGFSTYFFTKKGPLQVIEEGLSHGIKVFEISMEIPHVLNLDDSMIREMARFHEGGVEFSMHTPFFEINLGSFFDDIRTISREKIKKALDVAGRIGADPAVVHPGYTFLVGKSRAVEEKTKANFLEDLREIVSYGKERGVSIALENLHMPYFFFFDLPEFPQIYEAVPNTGIALDVGHAYIMKRSRGVDDPEESILSDLREAGVGHLMHVHLHGNRGAKDDHALLKSGADLGKIVRGLEKLGYKGKLIVESYDMEKYGMAPVVEELARLRKKSGRR